MFKVMLRYIYSNSSILRRWWFWLSFVSQNKYIPNFEDPKTYNEKVNYRKNNPKNNLFSICSDKIAAKEYVADKIGPEYIIPNYFIGESITPDKIKEIISERGDCLLKANHNSGPVKLLTTTSTDDEIKSACECVNQQLTVDFGKLQNEPWYSDIKPGVLVEQRLHPEDGDTDLKDYKFHVFKQNDGTVKIVLGIYFDRGVNTTASFFDEELNYLPFSYNFCSVKTVIKKPVNFEGMLSIAKTLAEPFSYVRVDFYNIKGNIYFGELTFADGSGGAPFSFYQHDLWMGNLWQGDPCF